LVFVKRNSYIVEHSLSIGIGRQSKLIKHYETFNRLEVTQDYIGGTLIPGSPYLCPLNVGKEIVAVLGFMQNGGEGVSVGRTFEVVFRLVIC